ncbi:hypothetical protein AURDEDRAFT_173398 [Auricularia subglabra TFB-10046 SS5]|uniref:Uncharacterized protein n=1 Tax=Auricularia subglabra (strain TFB-10046 / SS5) TaxID=717982 RepID=J0WVY3_AURST|nr:hypothetical protein AURDEDRAFT_173398 [Auricularia subglabra TFB-10046 SS5]
MANNDDWPPPQRNHWGGRRPVPVIPTTGYTVNNGPLFHFMHYPLVFAYPNFQIALPEDAAYTIMNPAPETRMWFVVGGFTYTGRIVVCSVQTVYSHANQIRWNTRYVRVAFANEARWWDLWEMLVNNRAGIHQNQTTPLTNAPPPPPAA